MMSPRELYEHLHTAAFNEDVTYAELIHVALAFAVFWYFVFEIGKFLLGKWSYGKPWLKVSQSTNAGLSKRARSLFPFLYFRRTIDRRVAKGSLIATKGCIEDFLATTSRGMNLFTR